MDLLAAVMLNCVPLMSSQMMNVRLHLVMNVRLHLVMNVRLHSVMNVGVVHLFILEPMSFVKTQQSLV